MSTYFTADQHLGHFNIIKYENRPFVTVNEMDHALIANWNKVVKPTDLVYHLGDVSMYKKSHARDIMSELNGTKVLIRGNHDKSIPWMLDCGFAAVLESAMVKIGRHDCIMQHVPVDGRLCGFWQIHGHVHSKWKVDASEKRICVSVENWGYAPVHEKELISIMDKNDNTHNNNIR